MVSKRWQRVNLITAHIGLAIGVTLPLYILEQDIDNGSKLMFIALGYLILVPSILQLHRRYANKFVRVYRCDYEMAARAIQRLLNTQRLAFAKQTYQERVVFQIRSGEMQLHVDAFMLNMPIDDHLTPEVATKLTLHPETTDNADQMRSLRLEIDEAFANFGW